MKYVNFHKLKIKNFLSIGEDEVVVNFAKGLHIITGINRDKEDRRNGVGKSTIADALYFAIFGNTIREIKKEYIANNLTNGQCQVEISFNVNSPRGNDEFVIIRTLNPSRLRITKNGIDKTRDSIVNTDEYIQAVLSSSPEVFQNCVIMTLNGTMPFMSKTKSEKRKFIEQVFNLQIFSDMMSNLRDDINKVSKNHDIELAKQTEVKNLLDNYKITKENKKREQESKISSLKNNITSNCTEIENIKKQIAEIVDIDISGKEKDLENLNLAYEKLEPKIEDIITEIADLNSEVKSITSKLSQAGTDKDICPTCLRPIENHDREHLHEKKASMQNDITKTNEIVNAKKTVLNDFKDKQSKLKKHILKLSNDINSSKVNISNRLSLQTHVTKLIDFNSKLEENLKNITDGNDVYDQLIKEASERFDNISIELQNIKNVINLLDVVKFVISEEGVKSYIVKKILQNFNSKLAFYLKKLDSNSICIFNEYFEEEILNEKGKICSYNNFSGAEKKAIDLACLFSFMDMRKSQGNVHYNVSIYDELLDSSLDEKGVDLVLDILKDRSTKYNECVFIISHRKESIKSATGDVIFLEKYNGITKRVNFVD